MEETKIGRLDHKIGKLLITKNVPGTEWLQPYAMSGDGGITLEEYAPFGVIGAILPVTHSVPTLTGNVINMVAAGNSIVFNPHPGGARSAAMAVRAYNEAINREIGIDNLITTIESPSLESFDLLCKNPHRRPARHHRRPGGRQCGDEIRQARDLRRPGKSRRRRR